MIWRTALITLVSTLLIAILALRSQQENGSGSRMAAPASGWEGGGAAMSGVTGASSSWTGSGQRGDWGQNRYGYGAGTGSMSITGASSSYSSGGKRGNWGGDHDDHDDYDDHDGGWEGDDD